MNWLDEINWDANGLIPAIAQEQGTGKILMVAWMNREALQLTNDTKQAVYWSRSRNKLWRKGEESGHIQKVHEIRVDCDEDVILLSVEQIGGSIGLSLRGAFAGSRAGGHSRADHVGRVLPARNRFRRQQT